MEINIPIKDTKRISKYAGQCSLYFKILKLQNTFLILEERLCLNVLVIHLS